MTTDHAVYTSDYLSSTQAVLFAGRRLQNTLGAERSKLEYAVTGLERAAQQHEQGGTSYRAFMFSALDTLPESNQVTRERVTEDALASVLTDMQVANVLMAAGQASGEAGERAEPRLLDEALLRLDNTTRVLERSLPSPLAAGAEPGRFGFAEAASIPEVARSPDVPSAIATFKSRSEEVLTTLVSETQAVVTSVITALSKLDTDMVLAALSKLGVQVQDLPKIGRLFRQGIEKLAGAVNALIRLLGGQALEQIKARVEKIWQDVKNGEYITRVLEWAFEIDATRGYIAEMLALDGLTQEALDAASDAVAKLAAGFKENMAMARGIAAAIGLAGTVLALTPLAGPQLALLAASAYVAILAGIVLIGMDYTDASQLLQRVRGVREIAAGLRPAQP
jgi:hypothetical protein